MAKNRSRSSDHYFSIDDPLRFEGERFKATAKRPFGYRWYDPKRKVLGKRMEDHLRFAVCYWHSFVWQGTDPFGGDSFQRPWHAAGGDPMQQAEHKADVAFDLFRLLRAPYFTFHALGRHGALLEQWQAIKTAASDALIAAGGTITHHHAVGRDHRPWYDRQRPEVFAAALRAAKRELDPQGMLNPGVLIDP